MKKFTLFFLLLIFCFSGFAQSKKYVEILYFHRTIRCSKCQAIEKTTIDLLESDYKKEYESKSIVFRSVNCESIEIEDSTLTAQYEADGPKLMIVHHDGKKYTNYDLSDVALTYALTHPAKLRNELKKKIDLFFR